MIGTFGKVAFVTSAKTIRTISEYSRSTSSRWGRHNVVMRKPLLEFMGPDLGTISFSMKFDVSYGVNPRKEIDRLTKMCEEGNAEYLIVAKKRVGKHRWVISTIDEEWLAVDNRGRLLVANANITLEEYRA